MMATLNVNTSVHDEFYRYKMPRFILQIEGKKTIITNMRDVGKALNRPPSSILKYFGRKLGTQSNFDLKNDKFLLRGVHATTKLQDLLNDFIRKYLLCARCCNPETQYIGNCLKCRACSFLNKNSNLSVV